VALVSVNALLSIYKMKSKIKDVIVVVRLFIYSLCGGGEGRRDGQDNDFATLAGT